MAFILIKDIPGDSFEELKSAWKAYYIYLESVKDRLPKTAYEFATAPWHFFNPEHLLDYSDPRTHMAPHDAWLEVATIAEPSSGDRSQNRSIDISVRLLGSYHDGHIELAYSEVQSYTMIANPDRRKVGEGHGDWLYDEIRLSERGYLLHEIEWEGCDWLIECKDFSYKWLPFDKP